MAKGRVPYALWLAAAVALAYASQSTFTRQTNDRLPMMGVVYLLVAIVMLNRLFVVAKPWMWPKRLSGLRHRAAHYLTGAPLDRTLFAVLAAVACLLATAWGDIPNMGWPSLWAWLVGCACALVAARNGRARRRPLDWLWSHRIEIILVSACVLFALLVRSINLTGAPAVIDGDEAEMGVEARAILQGTTTQFFVTGWLGMPRMSFVVMGLPMHLWGPNIVALRLHSAIVGSATILTLYWLLRPETGVWIAQLSIWLLAALPFHVHFSRIGANNIEDGLIFTGTFAAFLWGVRSRKPLGWMLAGMFCAMSLYFYPGARLVVVLVIAFVGMMTLRTRGHWLRQHYRGLFIMLGGVLITGLPMLWFYARHMPEFNARVQTVGLIQSGRLAHEMQTTGRSAVAILWEQFLRSFFAWGFYRDRTLFYNDIEPMLQFWPAALFPIGLGLSLLLIRQRVFLLFLIWLFGLAIIGGALTIDPPSYARFTGLAPVLTSLVALAIVTLARLGKRFGLWNKTVGVALSALAVAAIDVNGIHHYFAEYTPMYRYSHVNAELGTVAGKHLSTLPPTFRAYFLGRPRMYYAFGNIRFLAPHIEGSDTPVPLNDLPPDFDRTRPAFFFSLPERVRELRGIQERLPGGTWIQIDRIVDGQPLYFAYQWNSNSTSLRHARDVAAAVVPQHP